MTALAPLESPAGIPLGMLVAALGRGSMRLFTEALRPTGLKPRHIAALTELRRGPLTQHVLGEATHTDPTKLVGLLNDLEAGGLVIRRRDPDDRRRHIVEISACGRERLAEVDRLVAEADDRLMAGLGPVERRALYDLLLHVVKNGGIMPSCATVVDCSEEAGSGCSGAAEDD